MKALYLVGFMGAGKTTISEELSAILEIPVIDTDQYIEQKTGRSIPQIFEESGEQAFRKLEKEILKELPTNDVIISTGGGVFVQEENRLWINKKGISFYLNCDWEELERRLIGDTSRPLVQKSNLDQLQALFEQRRPSYEQATYTIDTANKTIHEICIEMKELIK
ncbi:shikimate kinase [Metabacillus iocasae]|uniref:Shikimate kinase n=1 Tax=Priestia iocasae TaxID=2291674 RepID=A0ABS2QQ23_9BACI|nr:shikimate kinase [Metabacillus iocasae]MBM7701552.1 shikimate kinase [Metabacillus iocasae]